MDNTKFLGQHIFNFAPNVNSGETLILNTKIYQRDIGNFYTTQDLTLHSYCNRATFHLLNINITPEILRKLANELEDTEINFTNGL
jgi:hypothetical protein